jgi:hypothetical protein
MEGKKETRTLLSYLLSEKCEHRKKKREFILERYVK